MELAARCSWLALFPIGSPFWNGVIGDVARTSYVGFSSVVRRVKRLVLYDPKASWACLAAGVWLSSKLSIKLDIRAWLVAFNVGSFYGRRGKLAYKFSREMISWQKLAQHNTL